MKILKLALTAALAGALLVGCAPTEPAESEAPTEPELTAHHTFTEEDLQLRKQIFGLAKRDAADYAAAGDVDAPIVIIEFADYSCPHCINFGKTTKNQLFEEFVDTGKVRFEFRDYQFLRDESMLAAIATRAAGLQGMFWEYQDMIFENSPEGSQAEINPAVLIDFARQLGVPDLAKFEADLYSQELATLVIADREFGSSIGVNSTPTFIVGATVFTGAQPIEVFRQVIEQELLWIEAGI